MRGLTVAIFMDDLIMSSKDEKEGCDTLMRHVDELSRIHYLLMDDSFKHRLRQAQLEDEWTKAIIKALEYCEYEDFYIFLSILYKNPQKS